MGINPKDIDKHESTLVRRIISRFVPEHVRLSRTAKPGHLQLLGEELKVKQLLTRPLASVQDQHPGVDAMLIPLPKGYSVVINETARDTRQLYSLAHELGHIMLLEADPSTLGVPRPTRYRSSNSPTDDRKAEERLCDAIAAELLMPKKMFTAEVRESGRSLEHLRRLASLFGTSLTATAIRYWELLPEPCHLIRWRSPAHSEGIIGPTWQMRNRIPGPYLHPVTMSSAARLNQFRAIRETWKTLGRSVSYESLLVKYVTAGRRYVQTMTFETESIVFGSLDNRAALSAVYLSRT